MTSRAALSSLILLLGLSACREDGKVEGTASTTAKATASAAATTKPSAAPLATSSGPEPEPPAAPKLDQTEGPSEVTFAFAPIADRPFTVKTVRVKQKGRGGANMSREVTRTVKRVTVSKGDDGFRWQVEPVAFSVHGQRTSRVDELTEKMAVTYRLDAEGVLQDVGGYEKITDEAKSFLRPKTLKQLGPSLTPEALQRTRRQEWESRVSDLSTKKVNLGEPLVIQSDIQLPKGSAPTYSVIRFGPWLDCPAPLGRCLRVESHQHTHVDQLAELTGVDAETIRAASSTADEGTSHDGHGHGAEGHDDHAGERPGAPPIGYAVHRIRIVDPTTSMPLWERIERNIDLGIAQLADVATSRYEYPTEPAQ